MVLLTGPFRYAWRLSGRMPDQVEQVIVNALAQKLDPQVLVTMMRNASNTVTVVGEVDRGGTRMIDCSRASKT